MNYNKLVEDYFFNATQVGTIDIASPLSIKVNAGNRFQGEYFDLYITFTEEGLITQALFKAFGSPYLIAGLQWCCKALLNSHVSRHPCIDSKILIEKLEIPQVRYSLAILIETGYKKAIHRIQNH